MTITYRVTDPKSQSKAVLKPSNLDIIRTLLPLLVSIW